MSALGLVLMTSMGCTKAGKFAGTWLLSSKGPLTYTGDCYDPDDPTYMASTLDTIEIFGADNGQIVVDTGGGAPLVGDADGNAFTATYRYEEIDEDSGGSSSTDWEEVKLTGALDGGVLSGKFSDSWGDSDYSCALELTYTASRIDERDTL
jgi:hypothetical protein